MSEDTGQAKATARLNLMSVLTSRQQQENKLSPPSPTDSPTPSSPTHKNSPPSNGSPSTSAQGVALPSVVVPPSSSEVGHKGMEITAESLAEERQQHVKSVVKALQIETRGPPVTPPPIPQRPIARTRSPFHSPTRQRTIADPTTRSARHTKSPPRPPPPKIRTAASMKKTISLDTGPAHPSVTPPASPMRRRSMDMEKESKPKPPVRRRKKFQGPGEDAGKRVSAIDEHEEESGEGVGSTSTTCTTTPTVVESCDQVNGTGGGGDAPAVQTSSGDDAGGLERSGEGSGEAEEGWEVISTNVPNINVSVDDQQQQNQRGFLRKSKSEDASVVNQIIGTASPDLLRTLTKKKKPPPFRPPPYNASLRTPPLPTKKRKATANKLAEEAKKVVQTEEVSREASPDPEEHQQLQQPAQQPAQQQQDHEEMVDGHIYEALDPVQQDHPTPIVPPVKFLENGHTKYLGSSSSDASLSPSLSRSTSVGNSDSVFVGGDVKTGGGGRSTVSLSALRSARNSVGGSGKKSRPYSEAVSSTSSARDFETSFEMIPGSGSKLEDVMSTLRENDEKLHDANIYELVQACSRAMPHITTTTELPPRIPDFPTDARSLVIHELYTTEYTYVKGLEVVDEVFKDILAPVLLDETSRVFANINDILAFNKGFLALLHSRLTDWGPDVSIGDIFIGMFTPSHKSMYAIYCSNYDSAEMMVVTRLKRRKDFELALQACLSNPRVIPGLTLPAYLITPVQRVPRYILLLKDIIKRTSEDHPDYKNLKQAQDTMGELADYINAQVSESQTKKTLDTLKNKVQGLADLDSRDRNLVKEGQVFLKNVKKLYQCILFNDLLVFAHGDSRQSIVELQLSLEAVWVEDLEDLDPQTSNEDAIEVYTPERPYTIYTQTRAEKTLWLTKLRETIYQHLRDHKKCKPDKDCNTVARNANFYYADQRVYNGHYVDAIRNGKGTMTWPNKSCYVGDWVDDERSGEGEFTYNTGDVYSGKWSEDKQNGFGELQFASDDIYRGNWKDGVRHGKGRIVYSNGDTFDGQFSSGQIEGEGTLKCVNGVEYSGDWKHSQRHGKGRLRFVSGNVYNGEFQYNQIHGQGVMTYRNRDRYDGRWKNGMRNGQGMLKSRREGEYDGSWENDLRHGFGKQKYPNGDYYEGGWEMNRRHGKGKLTYSTGQVYEGEFVNDNINGEGEMKYSKISKYQGGWVTGLRHGLGAMVYEDKSSYNGDWKNGLRHGNGEFVSADGAIYKGMWVHDKPHGKGVLSIAGPQQNLRYTYSGDWVNGKREGRGEEQSQYGQYKGGWKADMKQGVGEERTLVGTIFEGSWDKGRKHGRGVRKMIFGSVDEQTWKAGQLTNDPSRMTAVELPYISRSDL